MNKVAFSHHFKKLYRKAPLKIRQQFNKRLDIFINKPFDPLLNNHALVGNFLGKRSINITGDWRAIYSISSDGVIIFELLGTHSQLYK